MSVHAVQKNKIMIGKHRLDCPNDMVNVRYKDDVNGKYDGVHMYGSQGRVAYTMSVLDIIKSSISNRGTNLNSSPSSHSNCEQAVYERTQNQKRGVNAYSVPVSNKFDVLGN